MAESVEITSLPPGWDSKYDIRTGKYYYINHYTKTTTWEDPRIRYKQLHDGVPAHVSSEHIPLQPMHGSPYHVYPAKSNPPVQAAFQGPSSGVPSLSASPQLTIKVQQMEMSPVSRASAQTQRSISQLSRIAVQETSFSTGSTSTSQDTDAVVAKINTMFPTVNDTHIRMLLKKYLKGIFPAVEETLILDVLASADNNVQKASEKLLTMGYEKKDSAAHKLSAKKKLEENAKKAEEEMLLAMLQAQKKKTTEEKNQLKLRLQTQYKTVAERIISMALESVDYSEEKACQILDIVVQEDNNRIKSSEEHVKSQTEEKENIPSNSSSSLSAPTNHLDDQLQPEQSTILTDEKDKTTDYSTSMNYGGLSVTENDKNNIISPTNGNRLKQNRPKAKNENAKVSPENVENQSFAVNRCEYKSIVTKTPTHGPNPEYVKGPNDDLLLVDYVTWRGANADYVVGRKGLSRGPDMTIRTERTCIPRGPNKELCSGPAIALVKGSIYTQLTRGMADVKVN